MADKDEILDHNYDGIQEYDNDLPAWWRNIFWLTGIFAVVYVGYYHFGPGPLQEEQLALDMKELESIRASVLAKQKKEDAKLEPYDTRLPKLAANTEVTAKGQSVYETNCVACHRADGGGLVGPNLTDSYYIHGSTPTDYKRVIENGVLEKGMIAWKEVLSPEDIDAVVAYIWNLQGTSPSDPKAAEGELVERG